MERPRLKKYQIIMQDEYDNLYHIGFYDDLMDGIDDVNDWLQVYGVSIEDISEYASTFSTCFDKEIETEDGTIVMIRGFVFEDIE